MSGIVYDPTNYHNALLRYYQLQQQLVQLKNSYAQIVTKYNLALADGQILQNMPARYRAQFSQWRNVTSLEHLRKHRRLDQRHQLRPAAASTPATNSHNPASPLQPGPTLRNECR